MPARHFAIAATVLVLATATAQSADPAHAPTAVVSTPPAPPQVAANAAHGATPSSGAHAAPAGAVHWTYEGEAGPDRWFELSPLFEACGKGKRQSPIDIRPTMKANLPDLELHYPPRFGTVVNNGHTIQFNSAPGNIAKIGDRLFGLLQFHFHTPSENHVNGIPYPLEAHFVHRSADGVLAVIGVLIAEGDANTELEKILANSPAAAGESRPLEETPIVFRKLLPLAHKYFQFAGSLTTPPCSEGVRWQVLAAPITASADQIARFQALMHSNARPLQIALGRPVIEDND